MDSGLGLSAQKSALGRARPNHTCQVQSVDENRPEERPKNQRKAARRLLERQRERV